KNVPLPILQSHSIRAPHALMSTSPQKAAEHVDIRSYDHMTPQGRIDQTNICGVKKYLQEKQK
ncbi:hypothetical protein, partial [Cupriavidus sp. 2SB]|uniref:hypothetical protein n=1 Tax=Cupriavidus sp. 2SB TaxID=2502199 RepID=UPI001BB1449F